MLDIDIQEPEPGAPQRLHALHVAVEQRHAQARQVPEYIVDFRQVACLPAENQVAHERYMADRAQDLVAWEQIALDTLAGSDAERAALALGRH